MEAIYLVCGARRPQLKRDPLGSTFGDTMERHYCYSCENEHMFLHQVEWRAIEPLVKRALVAQSQIRRMSQRRAAEAPDPWIPALEAFNQLTGDVVTKDYSLLHRQLIHTGKWKPRGPDGCPLPDAPEGAA